jgi:hypothetical protein
LARSATRRAVVEVDRRHAIALLAASERFAALVPVDRADRPAGT